MNKHYIRDDGLSDTQLHHVGTGFRWFFVYLLGVVLLVIGAIAYGQEPRTAEITFNRPTQYTDGTPIAADTPIAYHVYQGTRGGGEKVRVATITETGTTITTGLPPGETCWQVSAVANGTESALSNEACKSFPWPATEAITITVR